MRYLWLIALALTISAGCDRNKTPPQPTNQRQTSVQPPSNSSPSIKNAMHEYFETSTAVRDAVVHGDLESARAGLARLAEHDIQATEAPDAWKPFLQMWRATARVGAQSVDLSQSATAIAKLATQCAACHQATRQGPSYDPSGWVEEIEDLQTHMLLLRWATDRMWEGLTEPWERAWTVGAETLTEAPLQMHHFSKLPKARQVQVKQLAQSLKDLAEQAKAQQSPEARAESYAELITTCSHCHQLLDR